MLCPSDLWFSNTFSFFPSPSAHYIRLTCVSPIFTPISLNSWFSISVCSSSPDTKRDSRFDRGNKKFSKVSADHERKDSYRSQVSGKHERRNNSPQDKWTDSREKHERRNSLPQLRDSREKHHSYSARIDSSKSSKNSKYGQEDSLRHQPKRPDRHEDVRSRQRKERSQSPKQSTKSKWNDRKHSRSESRSPSLRKKSSYDPRHKSRSQELRRSRSRSKSDARYKWRDERSQNLRRRKQSESSSSDEREDKRRKKDSSSPVVERRKVEPEKKWNMIKRLVCLFCTCLL